MGEALYELYREVKKAGHIGPGTRIYAPVGTHEDLLAYLVRRLLENGANTSFVNRLADEEAPISEIIADPVEHMMKQVPHRSAHIPKPENLLPDRKNSQRFRVEPIPWRRRRSWPQMDAFLKTPSHAAPLIGGEVRHGDVQPMRDPSELTRVGGRSRRGERERCDRCADARAWRLHRMGQTGRRCAGARFSNVRPIFIEANSASLMALGRARSRQEPAECAGRSARGRRFPALLRGPRARLVQRLNHAARSHGRNERIDAARTRRLRLHLAVEFPAGDFHGAGGRCVWPPAIQCSRSPRNRHR